MKVIRQTYHHPKSTSSNSVQVVAKASNPMEDKPRDFHMSIDWIDLLYCDIVIAVSSIFAWLNAKFMCFRFRLFFSNSKICSSAKMAWNKSKRSKFLKRPNGLPLTLRMDAFLSDNSVVRKKNNLNEPKCKYLNWICWNNNVVKTYLLDYHRSYQQSLSYLNLWISLSWV